MKQCTGRLRDAIVLGLLVASSWAASAMTLPELQRLLRRDAQAPVAFEEVRESPWLSSPVTTRGKLQSTPQALEKRVESPRRETWRLLEDRMEWTGPDGARKVVPFSQAPALQALAGVTRRATSGSFSELERDFLITLRGDEKVWSVHLQPRTAQMSRLLESVELQGTGERLQVIIVNERRGERTTTRLLH
jgi:hypothetical protein